MNTTSKESATQDIDAVESLLEKAQPRAVPPPRMAHEVRAAVQSEWAAVSGRRRRWRAARNVAVAASVLLAVVFAFTNLQQTGTQAIEVALLDQSRGTIRLYSKDSDAAEGDVASTLFTGQILQTGKDSAAGLAWSDGGSLRVDEQSRIELISASEIFLHSGRVYFDSLGTGSDGELTIGTAQGLVSHIGTQYIAATSDAGLIVSVREGKVVVTGDAYDQTVNHGQRAEMRGSNRPVITNTNGIGSEWEWVESVSPRISVDGMSAYDFLQWVGRETGHTIHFASESVNETARTTELKGTVNGDPRDELRLRMMTMDLEARFDAEMSVITISE